MAALEAAKESRRRMAEVRNKVRSGEWTLERAFQSLEASRIRVESLVRCLPGVGPAKAASIVKAAGVADGRRVGGLGPHQVKRLVAAARGLDGGER